MVQEGRALPQRQEALCTGWTLTQGQGWLAQAGAGGRFSLCPLDVLLPPPTLGSEAGSGLVEPLVGACPSWLVPSADDASSPSVQETEQGAAILSKTPLGAGNVGSALHKAE